MPPLPLPFPQIFLFRATTKLIPNSTIGSALSIYAPLSPCCSLRYLTPRAALLNTHTFGRNCLLTLTIKISHPVFYASTTTSFNVGFFYDAHWDSSPRKSVLDLGLNIQTTEAWIRTRCKGRCRLRTERKRQNRNIPISRDKSFMIYNSDWLTYEELYEMTVSEWSRSALAITLGSRIMYSDARSTSKGICYMRLKPIF